jgi:Sigma-70 factor, region 1.1
MELRELIKKAIEIGEQAGFITFDQLNELCPNEIAPDEIEAVVMALSDRDIQIIDDRFV